MSGPTIFRPSEALRVLAEARVEFVVVGGLAAIAHGCSQATRDLDVVTPFTVENCQRILDALKPYEPRFYQTIGKPLVTRSAEDLARFRNLYFSTTLGIIDLLGSVPPVGDHSAVQARAIPLRFLDREYAFISLDDLIEIKAFVARPKDKLVELELRAIRARLSMPT